MNTVFNHAPAKTGILGSRARRSALLAMAVLAVIAISGPAMAQQEFALFGTWQKTDQNGVFTVVFNPDWTFQSRQCWPPGPGGTGSGCAQWRGWFKPTGASSWVAKIAAIQICAAGGGCNSCPQSPQDLPGPANYGCEMARNMFGLTLGVQKEQGLRMQGPNQGTFLDGSVWRRIQ